MLKPNKHEEYFVYETLAIFMATHHCRNKGGQQGIWKRNDIKKNLTPGRFLVRMLCGELTAEGRGGAEDEVCARLMANGGGDEDTGQAVFSSSFHETPFSCGAYGLWENNDKKIGLLLIVEILSEDEHLRELG